jgi:putative ABC transport system permease protein
VEARQPGRGAPAFADYPVRGLDDAFLHATTFGLGARAAGYESDREVWNALRTTPGLAVVDGFVVPHRDNWSFGVLPEFRLRGFFVDDGTFDAVPVEIRDPQTGAVRRLRVIGVLKDSAPLSMLGLSTSQRTLAAFGDRAAPTGFVIALAPGVDADAVAKGLEAGFLSSGMQAQSTTELVDDALGASRTVQRIVLGFLGLGLVIGVAALGVVSARSVVERRQQIGVLRSIGFQRTMVEASFLVESALVAVGAIVIGTFLGIVLSYNIVADAASRPNWSNLDYRLPWPTLALVFGSVLVAALIATLIPARRAAATAPANALRYQ